MIIGILQRAGRLLSYREIFAASDEVEKLEFREAVAVARRLTGLEFCAFIAITGSLPAGEEFSKAHRDRDLVHRSAARS